MKEARKGKIPRGKDQGKVLPLKTDHKRDRDKVLGTKVMFLSTKKIKHKVEKTGKTRNIL